MLPETTSLLEVSQEIRTIVLEVVFENLIVYSSSIGQLARSLRRLSRYYQLSKDAGVPTTERSAVLAQIYRRFPLYFPELDRFAMMSHGLRHLHIQFDWLESLHFFKVSAGTLPLYRGRDLATVEYFERLPNLRRVDIVLPSGWWKDRCSHTQPGPRLFHEDDPCPRALHRFIYESIAEELVSVRELHVTGFVDETEEEMFWKARQSAKERLKITRLEAREMYMDLEGGVPVHTHVEMLLRNVQSVRSHKPRGRKEYYRYAGVEDEVFPPRCQCEVPCKEAFPDMEFA
ncbi:uncharacterized protein EI97DRAFT_387424 [Westerdykella ornata]|uniref:Uncharacterized protein n=1 Tax=Westerdykella ornata TaxID=318751 RepID=A0A6A6J627_WESOR|nr:uncharacterized protein EI97DRAFT_387424 [Westerdykella ornata]KAF2271647.1 hypothetical protein EI97DRAFT_387424 [Westerdykella ornata]